MYSRSSGSNDNFSTYTPMQTGVLRILRFCLSVFLANQNSGYVIYDLYLIILGTNDKSHENSVTPGT